MTSLKIATVSVAVYIASSCSVQSQSITETRANCIKQVTGRDPYTSAGYLRWIPDHFQSAIHDCVQKAEAKPKPASPQAVEQKNPPTKSPTQANTTNRDNKASPIASKELSSSKQSNDSPKAASKTQDSIFVDDVQAFFTGGGSVDVVTFVPLLQNAKQEIASGRTDTGPALTALREYLDANPSFKAFYGQLISRRIDEAKLEKERLLASIKSAEKPLTDYIRSNLNNPNINQYLEAIKIVRSTNSDIPLDELKNILRNLSAINPVIAQMVGNKTAPSEVTAAGNIATKGDDKNASLSKGMSNENKSDNLISAEKLSWLSGKLISPYFYAKSGNANIVISGHDGCLAYLDSRGFYSSNDRKIQDEIYRNNPVQYHIDTCTKIILNATDYRVSPRSQDYAYLLIRRGNLKKFIGDTSGLQDLDQAMDRANGNGSSVWEDALYERVSWTLNNFDMKKIETYVINNSAVMCNVAIELLNKRNFDDAKKMIVTYLQKKKQAERALWYDKIISSFTNNEISAEQILTEADFNAMKNNSFLNSNRIKYGCNLPFLFAYTEIVSGQQKNADVLLKLAINIETLLDDGFISAGYSNVRFPSLDDQRLSAYDKATSQLRSSEIKSQPTTITAIEAMRQRLKKPLP